MEKRAEQSPLRLPLNRFLVPLAPQVFGLDHERSSWNGSKGRLRGDRQIRNFGQSCPPRRIGEPLLGKRVKGSFNRERGKLLCP